MGVVENFYYYLFLHHDVPCNVTQQLVKKQIDTLNSTRANLVKHKHTATFQPRCKQYFSVKF